MSLKISIFESQYPLSPMENSPKNPLIFMENAPENPRNYVVNFRWPHCGSSWHEILITMRRSCNSEIVYSLSLMFVVDMKNMRNNHFNTVSCVFCFPTFPAKVNTVLSAP